VAHGLVADRLGDPTARLQGRLTLNPLPHIDPIGALAFVLAGFGWAKPVPVNFGNLRRPKRDMLWVAAAGPAANFVMALCWALLMKATLLMSAAPWSEFLLATGRAGIQVNVIFLVLNLLSVPPLGGLRIITSLLPHWLAYRYAKIEPYGIFILLGIIIVEGLFHVPLLGAILFPPYELIRRLLLSLVNL